MWKSQRVTADEALGDFCHRVGIPAVEAFMESYEPDSWRTMPAPFAPPSVAEADATVGIASELLSKVEAEAAARDMDVATLLDTIVREALEE